MFDYISAHSRWDVKTVEQLDYIYDSLLVESEMKKLQEVPFINELVSHYDAVINTKAGKSERKVLMYSDHDSTMSYVLNTLGVFNGLAPPYTSLVMFELLYMLGWKVRISYRNDTTLDPYVLTIPGCKELCPMNLFLKLTRKVRPKDWVADCELRWTDIIYRNLGMEKLDNSVLMVARRSMVIVIICLMALML